MRKSISSEPVSPTPWPAQVAYFHGGCWFVDAHEDGNAGAQLVDGSTDSPGPSKEGLGVRAQ